jgi:hypothetical protein
MNLLRRAAASLSAGYILMFYSERVFAARFSPENTPLDLLLTWLVYSLLAFLFLAALEVSRARRWTIIFLCGAVFGWMDEGALAHTMFQTFPLYLSWTGLAWHALISVLIGWYLMRRAILEWPLWRGLLLAAGIGFAWGFWALWWPEDIGALISPADFLRHAGLTGLGLVAAHAAYETTQPVAFRPTPGEWIVVGAFFLLWFAFVTVPTVPVSLLILPPLMAVTVYALLRAGRSARHETLFQALRGRFPLNGVLVIAAVPLTASLTYLAGHALVGYLPANVIVLVITLPLGFIFYGLGMFEALRKPPRPPEGTAEPGRPNG